MLCVGEILFIFLELFTVWNQGTFKIFSCLRNKCFGVQEGSKEVCIVDQQTYCDLMIRLENKA